MRINGLDTAWWVDDVDAAAKAHPDGILAPKISRPGHLKDIANAACIKNAWEIAAIFWLVWRLKHCAAAQLYIELLNRLTAH